MSLLNGSSKGNDIHDKGINQNKIAIPTSFGYQFIATKDVIRCEADCNYTNFHLVEGKKILVCRNLLEYEKILGTRNFVRVHKSHLINLDHIEKFLREGGGYLVMDDESIVEVSRRKKTEFLERMKARYMIPVG